MTFILAFVKTYSPFILAYTLGFFCIHIILQNKKNMSLGLHAFLGGGLGMGIAGLVGFLSLILFHQYHGQFVFGSMLLLTFASAAYVEFKLKKNWKEILYFSSWSWQNMGIFILFVIAAIPFWRHSHFYLYGGWDAWQTWNLKATFIFEGGARWQNMFDPALWRSSPHYPLLLPLINAYGYILHGSVHQTTNVLTSFFFAIMAVGVLVYGLKYLTQSKLPVLLGIALLTMPRYIKLSYSQYADIIMGYYLLCTILTLVLAKKQGALSWCILSGLFLGLLSFTKTEGFAFAALITLFSSIYFLWNNPEGKKQILYFLGAALLTGIWTLVFKWFYATENMSFINGLTSADKPSTWRRLQIIGYWYYREFISYHYNGLWFVLLAGLVINIKNCLNRYLWIIPTILFIYFSIITAYYYINTYFEITWWLRVSLHRINYALIPLACFWIFYGLLQKK